MEVGSNLVATESELRHLGIDISTLEKNLTLPNPEYVNKKRFGKGKIYGHIEPYICYLKKVGSSYIVPRYYIGELGKYGNEGRDVKIHFKFKLRDYQQKFWDDNSSAFEESTGILLEAACGTGKCHGKGTPILMYDGSVKNVEDIRVGDLLMGDDSTPRRVLSLARGHEEMFVVHQKKGIDYTVNRSHILSLQYRPWGFGNKEQHRKDAHNASQYGEVRDICIEDYLKLSKTQKSYLYGYCVPVEYSNREVQIPPYFLGAWLGDGTSRVPHITTDRRDRVLVHYYREIAGMFNCNLELVRQEGNNSNVYKFVGKEIEKGRHKNPLLDALRFYNLIQNKHIPDDYLINSRENRLQLLAGLLDTDGSYSTGCFDFIQKRKDLALQVRKLCWSLGFRVKLTKKIIKSQSYWRLSISGDFSELPTKLGRKVPLRRRINKDTRVNGISVESIGEGDYYGFTLDGNHRYCLADGTVTHNTIMAIYFSMIRGKQTMVLVPTYYLAKQWKQRIEESTDSTCIIVSSKDTEIRVDSDFTIIVLDLFTCRKLPVELIHNVGHVILDEAHRVGAEMYLPILDEVPAIYRTALTATFRRTDGVHKILKYHFGECIQMKSHFPRPLVYSVKTNVQIRSILSKNKKYEHFVDFLDRNNVPYSETKSAIEFPSLDLRDVAEKEYKKGVLTKTAFHEIASCLKRSSEMPYSVVDSYLNEHSGRRKIAIRVIQECLDSGRSVLFLSKRKSTLKDLHKYFAAYKPMLIISETNSRSPEDENYLQNACPLIFGISQLAKEGLDIDRLDTLIIHLPMKDTEQAIGRINRLYEGKKFPVCLYLLDNCPITFAVFRNAQKFISINADYKGERTLLTLKSAL